MLVIDFALHWEKDKNTQGGSVLYNNSWIYLFFCWMIYLFWHVRRWYFESAENTRTPRIDERPKINQLVIEKNTFSASDN